MSASIWAPGTTVLNIDAETSNLSEVFTASNGQTVFNLTIFTYTPGTESIAVYRNGQRLIKTVDWSETDLDTVTLSVTPALIAGEKIEVVAVLGATSANVVLAEAAKDAAVVAQMAAELAEANAQGYASDALASANAAAAAVIGEVNAGNTNAVLKTSNTGSALIPSGTTAQRDEIPTYGAQRANTTLNQQEWWNGTAWVPMGGGATGAPGNYVFIENDIHVTGNYTLTTNKNAVSAGPIIIDAGVTVTIPAGSTWSIV